MQAFYELAPDSRDGNAALRQLLDVGLTQEIDGTWTVRWQRAPGGDVRVNVRNGFGQAILLGEAASDIGQFPIRLALPAMITLEVVCIVGGRTVQTLLLRIPSAKN